MLRRNILIFHNAALGDFIVTWPLAMACGRLFPQSRVIYVTAGGKGRLAEHVLGVESVDIESGFTGLWSDPAAVAPAARKMIDGAALILSFAAGASPDDGNAWAANIAAFAPEARVSHLSTKPPEDYDSHVARFIGQQLAADLPGVAAGTVQMIDSLSRRGFSSRPAKREGVLIHPGSGAERKNWNRDRFVELAARLKSAGHRVRVVLGEVELEKWGDAARQEFAAHAEIAQPASLVELSRALAEAQVVVCNDSGPAHLAGIIGAKTIALFGPTSSANRWRPLGPGVQLIDAAALDEITVDQVEAAVTAALSSSGESAAVRSASAPTEDG